jgi:hypothetical protein
MISSISKKPVDFDSNAFLIQTNFGNICQNLAKT